MVHTSDFGLVRTKQGRCEYALGERLDGTGPHLPLDVLQQVVLSVFEVGVLELYRSVSLLLHHSGVNVHHFTEPVCKHNIPPVNHWDETTKDPPTHPREIIGLQGRFSLR